MKWIFALLSIMCSMMVAEAGSASEFEGVIHIRNLISEHMSDMDWYAKGDKGRVEMQSEDGRKMFWIVDNQNQRMIMPLPQGKMYYEFDLSRREIIEGLPEYDIIRTGKTESVAGYACEIVTVKSKKTDKKHSDICVAKGLGYFMAMGDPRKSGQRTEASWIKQFRDLFKDGAFPLRTITYRDDGTQERNMEVTKIEKKRLDDALFTLPSDYKKFDMAEMMKGKGMGSGMPGAEPGMQSRRPRGRPDMSPGGDAPAEGQDMKMEELMKGFGDMMKQGAGKK